MSHQASLISVPVDAAPAPINYPPAHKKREKNEEQVALVSSKVLGATATISNLSGGVRSTYNLVATVESTKPSPALSALGFTTWFGILTGGLMLKGGIEEFETSKEQGDRLGQIKGALRAALGVCLSIGGLIFLPLRILVLVGDKALTGLVRVLGIVGSSFLGGASLLVCISGAVNLWKQMQKSNNTENILLAFVTTALGALGTTVSILGNVATAGVPVLVEAVMSVVVSLGWMGLDGYQFAQVLQSDQKSKEGYYDKLFTLVITLICAAATAAALFFSFGTPLIFIVLGLATAWLALQLKTL